MPTEKYQDRIDEAAQGYIDQFVSGNRQSTFREMFEEGTHNRPPKHNVHELGAIVGKMTLFMPPDYQSDFVLMLSNYVTNRMVELNG